MRVSIESLPQPLDLIENLRLAKTVLNMLMLICHLASYQQPYGWWPQQHRRRTLLFNR